MNRKRPISPDRIRKIDGSFSFISHKFITSGYINSLSKDEIILYYFLITVGDKNGVSYYHPLTICELLKLDPSSLRSARDGLISKDFLAYHRGTYQVLSLPKKSECVRESSSPVKIGDILKSICISNTGDGQSLRGLQAYSQ